MIEFDADNNLTMIRGDTALDINESIIKEQKNDAIKNIYRKTKTNRNRLPH